MIIDDLPSDLWNCLGDISSITAPNQGMTSDVGIIESKDKKFALKHSTGEFAAWLRCEYQVLLALEQTRVPAAKVHQFIDLHADGVEECWLLTDYIQGEQMTSKLSSPNLTRDHRCKLFRACGAALAAIHSLSPPSCIINSSCTWLDTLISRARGEQDKRALIFDKDIKETQARHEALLRLEAMRPSVESYTLVHGDCNTDNVLIGKTDVAGIVDWGCAAVGDPRYDIAQILCTAPEWATKEIDDDVIAFFHGYGTPPIPLEVIRFYQELSDMGGQGCMQIRVRL